MKNEENNLSVTRLNRNLYQCLDVRRQSIATAE